MLDLGVALGAEGLVGLDVHGEDEPVGKGDLPGPQDVLVVGDGEPLERLAEAAVFAEWLAACKGGPPTLCNFTDFAAPLTEVMLLGCLAQRVGKRIEWDPAAMKATNLPEAAAFVTRTYRKGWQI